MLFVVHWSLVALVSLKVYIKHFSTIVTKAVFYHLCNRLRGGRRVYIAPEKTVLKVSNKALYYPLFNNILLHQRPLTLTLECFLNSSQRFCVSSGHVCTSAIQPKKAHSESFHNCLKHVFILTQDGTCSLSCMTEYLLQAKNENYLSAKECQVLETIDNYLN